MFLNNRLAGISVSDPNTTTTSLISQKLKAYSEHPEFIKYLVYIFVTNEVSNDVRTAAGMCVELNLSQIVVLDKSIPLTPFMHSFELFYRFESKEYNSRKLQYDG